MTDLRNVQLHPELGVMIDKRQWLETYADSVLPGGLTIGDALTPWHDLASRYADTHLAVFWTMPGPVEELRVALTPQVIDDLTSGLHGQHWIGGLVRHQSLRMAGLDEEYLR